MHISLKSSVHIKINIASIDSIVSIVSIASMACAKLPSLMVDWWGIQGWFFCYRYRFWRRAASWVAVWRVSGAVSMWVESNWSCAWL